MHSTDKDQIHALSQRILVKCAGELGGAAALARHLEVSESTLAEWLSGRQVPPVEAVMKAIGPLLAQRPVAESLQARVGKLPIPKPPGGT